MKLNVRAWRDVMEREVDGVAVEIECFRGECCDPKCVVWERFPRRSLTLAVSIRAPGYLSWLVCTWPHG